MATKLTSRILALVALGSCTDGAATSTVDAASSSDSAQELDARIADAAPDAPISTVDCTAATTQLEKAICEADGFLDSLTATERTTANPAFTDTTGRTKWSNLPGAARPGVKMGAISAASQASALAMMQTVLTTDGMADLTGVRAADDYLGTQSGGGGGGGYSAANYYVAVFGTPSPTGDWAIMFGGHHMAFNVTFTGGVGYPVPNHLGVEPKSAFTLAGATYQPMAGEGAAMVAIFDSLSAADLSTAYLTGQTFSDVLIGPVEYGSGSSALAKAKFPTGANRKGVVVSSLSTTQQDLVTAAIAQWVADYDPSIADAILASYTSSTAFADTFISWGGAQASGVDVDVNGTYMRIDGPRAWIEVSCQAGVVIQGATHYHAIYRDKTFDYANTL